MKRILSLLPAAAALPLALAAVPSVAAAGQAEPWLSKYEPTAQSRKFPAGSAAERRARMHAVAHPRGTIRICGNNYIGDSPLGGWWQAAFAKYQPGIKLVYDLQTAANGIACLYEGRADIGIDHQPLFYDDLA